MSNNTSGNNQSNEFDTLELVHCVSRDESGSETILSAMLQLKTKESGELELFETVVINIAQFKCWNDDALEGVLSQIEDQLSEIPEYRSTDPTKIILDANMQLYCRQTGLHYNDKMELSIGNFCSNEIQFLGIGKAHITLTNKMLKNGKIVLSDVLKESLPDNLPKKICSLSSAFALLGARVNMRNEHLQPLDFSSVNHAINEVFGYMNYI